MSWFDSSFSFAKTALSQAQKSIDKVLDIKDGEVQAEINHGERSRQYQDVVLNVCTNSKGLELCISWLE